MPRPTTGPHPILLPARAGLSAAALLAVLASPVLGQRWTLPAEQQARVDSVFSFIGPGEPGCAIGVVRDGMLAYGRGYGVANLDWGVPISTSTVFDIASVSKQFTATALALLELDGVLSLDDEVRRWVPELPDYGRPVTIRQLLNHTSGMRDYLTLMRLAGRNFDDTFDELDGVDMIVRQRALNFEPGSEYLYSNSGYLVLAHIVRRATGSSLRDFLQARVFDPLGMAHTSIWDDNGEVLAERATGYALREGSWRISHAWNFQMGGDGQVITSVEDLARWDVNFYRPSVGGRALLDRLHTRGVLTSGDTIDYALGLSVGEYRGLRRVQHGGSWAGFRSQLTRYPEARASVIVLCNRSDASAGARAQAVADIAFADRFPEPPPVPSSAQGSAPVGSADVVPAPPAASVLAGYTDGFWSPELEVAYEVTLEGDALHLRLPGGEPEPTVYLGGDEFRVSGVRVSFAREAGRVASLTVNAGRVTGIVFERQGG